MDIVELAAVDLGLWRPTSFEKFGELTWPSYRFYCLWWATAEVVVDGVAF